MARGLTKGVLKPYPLQGRRGWIWFGFYYPSFFFLKLFSLKSLLEHTLVENELRRREEAILIGWLCCVPHSLVGPTKKKKRHRTNSKLNAPRKYRFVLEWKGTKLK